VEARIAAERGLLAGPLLDRLVALLRRAALPTTARDLRAPVDAEAVIAAMEKVRLIRAGSLRYVLPAGLGETLIADDVTPEELRAALGACAFSGCGA
jgi:3-dehydroquinate synthase